MKLNLIKEKINEIKDEMKSAKLWQENRPSDSAFNFHRAFAADTMSFEQWLQFIFIPNVEKLIETDGPWPKDSQVGAYSVRNTSADKLSRLLNEFDALFI